MLRDSQTTHRLAFVGLAIAVIGMPVNTRAGEDMDSLQRSFTLATRISATGDSPGLTLIQELGTRIPSRACSVRIGA